MDPLHRLARLAFRRLQLLRRGVPGNLEQDVAGAALLRGGVESLLILKITRADLRLGDVHPRCDVPGVEQDVPPGPPLSAGIVRGMLLVVSLQGRRGGRGGGQLRCIHSHILERGLLVLLAEGLLGFVVGEGDRVLEERSELVEQHLTPDGFLVILEEDRIGAIELLVAVAPDEGAVLLERGVLHDGGGNLLLGNAQSRLFRLTCQELLVHQLVNGGLSYSQECALLLVLRAE